jgi:hypothetical protein
VQRRPAVRLVLLPLLVLAVAMSAAWWASGQAPDRRAPLASALDALPARTQVAGFTDWAAIRSAFSLGDARSAADRAVLSDDASLRDLTSRSVLGQSIERMDDLYGWSPADLDWEAYGQSSTGSAMVARLAGSVSPDAVVAGLRALGYTRSDDVWTLDEAGRAQVGPELASVLGHVAVLEHERLVVAADRPSYVPGVVRTVRGSASLLSVRAASDVARELAGSDTALLQEAGFACSATSLEGEDDDVRRQADAAVARAGRLRRPAFAGRGVVEGRPEQAITFASSFGSPAVAAEQADVRRALARGPLIGGAGRIEDSLTLRDAGSNGSTTALRFALDPERGSYMVGDSPLLFAGCP